MRVFEEKEYKIFKMFSNQWALVTAGSLNNFNTCTIGWGSLGTIWGRSGSSGSVVTVYIHPARYTNDFMLENDCFTVTFFTDEYRKALGYLGSHSGRDGDKVSLSGLTPVSVGESVGFKEASMTILCKTLYKGKFIKDGLADDIARYYQSAPKAFPPDENGEWQPHYMYIGEIIDVEDKD